MNKLGDDIIISVIGVKTCARCCTNKNSDQFSNTNYKKRSGWCRECVKEYNKGYYNNMTPQQKEIKDTRDHLRYENNKEEILAKSKKDYEENKEIKIGYQRDYYRNNKDKILEKQKEYSQKPANKKRRNLNNKIKNQNDPIFKLRHNISTSVGKAIKRKGKRKDGSILNHLPQSIETIVAHLESLWSHPNNLVNEKIWMSWHNYGKYNTKTHNINPTWNIDHIIPQSDLPYTSMKDENFKICWDIKNLRPLNSQINVIEGVRRSRHR